MVFPCSKKACLLGLDLLLCKTRATIALFCTSTCPSNPVSASQEYCDMAKTNLGARKVHRCAMQTARKRSYDWQSSNFTLSFCGTKSQGLDAAYIRNSFPLSTWSNRRSTNRSAALFSGAQARMMLEYIRWCTCVYDARKRKICSTTGQRWPM